MRPKKVQLTGAEIVSPMFVMTPEMARRADEHAAKLAEEKKKKKEQYIVQREEKLKSLGLDNCDDFYVQKLVEVKAIAGEVEQEAMKEVQEMLEKIQETSGASASEAIPESAAPESVSEAEKSEALGNPSDLNSAKIIQILDSPTIISPPSSPITDSKLDNMTLSQKIKKLPKPIQKTKPFEPVYPTILQSIGEMSQMRVDICNRLPSDHPFQPPVIEPLNVILADTHTSTSTSQKPSQSTRLTPLQEGQSSAAAKGSEAPEEPNTSDLPHCDSPSNLFSLEKHLGGELIATPQKAFKSVPKKTDLVNQQPPKPSSSQTQTQTQTQIHNLPLSTSDQPSSSSNIQILDQPPLNILESEFIEAELLKISKEMQDLVQLRRVPTLSIDYEDQWTSLKSKASELLNAVS